MPSGREIFDEATEFILGHFTSSSFIGSILENGLVPDADKERAVDDRVPSDRTSVYLAASYDPFYFRRAVENHGGEGILIEVLAFKKNLLPDEAWIPSDSQTDWALDLYKSMCGGVCKHRGRIPLSHILSIYSIQGNCLYSISN